MTNGKLCIVIGCLSEKNNWKLLTVFLHKRSVIYEDLQNPLLKSNLFKLRTLC